MTLMKTIKTMISLTFFSLIQFGAIAQSAYGQIKGMLTDDETGPVIGATIKITQAGVLVGGTATDLDGKYTYKPLNPGYYDMVIQSSSHLTKTIKNVEITPDHTTYVDAKLIVNSIATVTITADIEEYKKPLVDVTMMDMKSLNAEEFLRLPIDRGIITQAVVAISSEVNTNADGELHVRGSRGEATEYIVDGMRVAQMNGIPGMAVENVSIITGGIPAQYGDLTSGVIVVTTKDYFSGLREKRMREAYYREKAERIKKEMEEKAMQEKRKKEIEEEKIKEQLQGKLLEN